MRNSMILVSYLGVRFRKIRYNSRTGNAAVRRGVIRGELDYK